MFARIKEKLHRTRKQTEATGSSEAALGHNDRIAETTVAAHASTEASNTVPETGTSDISELNDIIANNKWRKAFLMDGELLWATPDGKDVGDKVFQDTNVVYKVRQVGDVFYLAPKEAEDGTDEDVDASNHRRIEAFLDRVARDMIARSPKVPPPTFESIRPMLSENVDAILTLATRDGVVAIDVHGHVDNDFDNPGPEMHKETQIISRGHHSLMNIDKDPVFERLGKQLTQSLLALGDQDEVKAGQGDDGEDPGYESGGSDVSQDHCRYSPAYPMCKADCWLSQASFVPIPVVHPPRAKALDISASGGAEDIYTDIEPGFTRLLIIEPGNQDDEIRCTLVPMEIIGAQEHDETNPATRRLYEALSYTWGDATKCQTIECNGKRVGVGQNIFEALINVRLPDKRRSIWVDALCINQSDDAEKSRQVRHMYAIYRAATQVIVWLGPEADDSDFIMQAMDYIRSRKNRDSILKSDHRHGCLVQLARVVRGIEILTARPWFSRSWIRQEVAAAPKVIVQCGSRQVSWMALKRSANSIARLQGKYTASKALFSGSDEEFDKLIGPERPKSLALTFLKKDWVVGQSLLAESGDLRSIWYYHAGGMLELLIASRAFNATDARDKVYAILGMADVPLNPRDLMPRLIWGREAQKAQPVMKIDYSASVSEVYQHTAKYFINRDETLDVLCILPTHRDATSTDLPSWTPDWRVPLSSRPLYESWDYVSYKWGAAGFTEAEPQDDAELGQLNAKGFKIASIEQLHPLYPQRLPHLPERPTGSAILFEEGKHPRRFAESTRGISIVPSDAVVGDIIWILYGCKMPVVLRPATAAGMTDDMEAFRVIGPCWVATVMFGEAIKWFEERTHDLELRSIILV